MLVTLTRRFAAAFSMAILTTTAAAQAYPERPVRVVVPFPAGAATDNMARVLASRLQASLGQPFVVENRAGASGIIGAEYVSKAAPDGYTLLYTASGPVATSLKLYDSIRYDALRDFMPISLVIANTVVIATRSDAPFDNLEQLLARAKSPSESLSFGYGPPGGLPHLLMAMLQRRADTHLTFVPYKGGAPVVIDLLGGTLNLSSGNLTEYLEHIRAGKVKPIALASPVRSALLPDTPTLTELGYPDMVAETWSALLAPAGTPPEVIALLNKEIAKIQQDPEFVDSVAKQAAVVKPSSPEEAQAFIQNEAEKWGKVVVENGIKAN